MHISWARLASFCHLGFISDPLIVSKFHNETYDPKGQENKIYTILKGRETFYRRHTVPVTSCSEVKYVLKRVSFGSKDCTERTETRVCIFLLSVDLVHHTFDCFKWVGLISQQWHKRGNANLKWLSSLLWSKIRQGGLTNSPLLAHLSRWPSPAMHTSLLVVV